MAKSPKQEAEPAALRVPQIGDRVTIPRSESTYVISRVSRDGTEVDLNFPGTNLDRYRIRTDTLSFVDKAEAKPAPVKPSFDPADVSERVSVVRRENLERLDSDISILTKYLNTKGAPKATIDAMDALRAEQHQSWETAMERIEDLLEE